MKTFKEWQEIREEFLSKKDMENELNQLINTKFLKDKNPGGMHYAVFNHDNTVDVYIGKPDSNIDAKQLVSATLFFLKELGAKPGRGKINPEDSEIYTIPIISYPQYQKIKGQWDNVTNAFAKRGLEKGEIIDVADIGIEVEPGVWKLNKFIDGSEYYDSKNNQWIESIGKDKQSGEIFASVDSRFHSNEDYKLIWLR